MRNLISWASVASCSFIAQLLTFVFSGMGCGYAMMVLKMYRVKRFEMARDILGSHGQDIGIAGGINGQDWVGLRDSLLAGDFANAVTQVPVLGWYFLTGFLLGGMFSILVINISTFRQLRHLAQGGRAVVEKLGAFPFDVDAAPGSLKHLPGIVTELSKEFQLAEPELYILAGEEGMNAFVVGRNQRESFLVVTRGMRLMNTQQLRGIVAHELAHIRNGDMVHNMRLLAVELGINSVRHTAEWMLRTGWGLLFGSSSNYKFAMIGIQWGAFLSVLGLMLWPMGLISSLVGAVIMATTNRGRELRADKLAAKVLGTWAPIGDALKRILGHDHHGRIAGPDGRKLGHLMFAQANGRSGGLLATHPKIERRIKRADRSWDGVPIYESEEMGVVTSQVVDESVQVSVLGDLDPNMVTLFEDPEAVMLTMPTLLLFDPEHDHIVAQLSGGKLVEPIRQLRSHIADIDDRERFALIELVLQLAVSSKDPSVKQMLEQIRDLAPGNAWELQCWVHVYLMLITGKNKAVKVRHKNFDKCVRQTLEVISIGASIGKAGSAELQFQRVWGHTGLAPISVMCIDAYDFPDLDEAVETLRLVPRQLREELANGFSVALLQRNRMGAIEAAFLRYLCLRWEVATRSPIAPGFRE